MKAERDVQLSLVDGLDKGIGPVPKSLVTGLNADLITEIRTLYLTGTVLDVTYGRGHWWRRWEPEGLVAHDIRTTGVDFRHLPYADRAFDTVCYDPPYVPRHGPGEALASRHRDFRERYGLEISRSWGESRQLVLDGLTETARVASRWLLVKCCDFTNGRRFELMHVRVINAAVELGMRPHDLLILNSGTGPGGSQIRTIQRARRAHSYLLVFDTRPMHKPRRRPTEKGTVSPLMEQLRSGRPLEAEQLA